MSLSDDPTSSTKKNRARTGQEPRESPQDSSFLQSMETKMSPSDNPKSPTEKNRARTSLDPRESPQANSFLSSKEPHETSRSLKSRHGSFSENPNYFGGSLDSARNMGSQTYSGYANNGFSEQMMFTSRYANNGKSYLGVEPSNNSLGLRISKPQQMSTKALQLPYDNLERLGMEGDNSSSVTDWRSSSRKQKDEEGEELGDEDASNLKKPRVVWSVDLHKQFVAAVNQLGGAEKAVPSKILEQMNVPAGLTRKKIASHLQKYRNELRELGGVSQHQGSQDANFGPLSTLAVTGQLPTQLQAAGLGQPAMVSKSGSPGYFKQMNLLQGVPTGLQHQMSNSHSQLQAYDQHYPRRLGLEGSFDSARSQNDPTLMNGSIDLARWNSIMLEDKRKREEIKMMPTPKWTFKMTLTKDDVDPNIGQLSLPRSFICQHIETHMADAIWQKLIKKSEVILDVYDYNLDTMHELRLEPRSDMYLLVGDWRKDFIERRGLSEGDEIGFLCDSSSSRLIFGVVSRVKERAPAEDSTEYSQLQAYENYPRRLGLEGEGYGTNNEPSTLMNVEGSNVTENYPRRLGLEGYLDSAGSKKPINTDDEEVLKRYGSYRDNPNYYNDDNILLDTTNTLNPSGDMFEEFRPQEIMVIEVSQLSIEGQVRAIQEWGLPQSRLTHLVFCLTPRSNMPPGLDHYLATLLNIRHSFLHLEYQQGWFDERTAIRLFRDFARENHNDHPALVLLSEVTTPMFREVLRMT